LPVEAPASAGIGGGSGTAELGAAAEVFGAEEVALGDAEEVQNHDNWRGTEHQGRLRGEEADALVVVVQW
jgi:hypothetical protein